MASPQTKTLPVAVRVFPEDEDPDRGNRSPRLRHSPEGVLIIHTETAGQRKGFIGAYRFLVKGECTEEGLFYHRLSTANVKALQKYASSHRPEVERGRTKPLRVLARRDFLKLFYDLAYKARCLVVGFNLALHLSRLAFNEFGPGVWHQRASRIGKDLWHRVAR